MTLGTFGAILAHAINLEEQAEVFYGHVVTQAHEPLFEDLALQCARRRKRLERIRREGISEIILESIDGFQGEDYPFPALELEAPADLLGQGAQVEAAIQRFYAAAAEKLPIREVARELQRLAKENESNRNRMEQQPPRRVTNP